MLLAAAAAAFAISPASAACAPPSDATVLARSAKVVVWRRHKQVTACAERTGHRVSLFGLGGRGHLRIIRLSLFGERVVAAVGEHGYDYETGDTYHLGELAVYRLRGRVGPGLLGEGAFADVPELVRDHAGHFAWVETKGANGACPCRLRAGDTHESSLVTRRHQAISKLRLRGSSVSFDAGGSSEHVHVAFVEPRKLVPDPDPGGRHAHFKLTVPLPGDLPPGGRPRAEINDVTNYGTCHDESEPKQQVSQSGGQARIVLSHHWCRGRYGGYVFYRWGDPRERGPCGRAHTNCAGYVTLGHFWLRVRNLLLR